MSTFAYCELNQIPRDKNQRADFLARVGSSAIGGGNRKIELILGGRHKTAEDVMNIQAKSDWRTDIQRCLGGVKLTSKKDQAAMEAKARYFFLDRGILFKFSFSHNALRCLGETEAAYVMEEAHQGCCGDHAGGRNLARRLLHIGYYWPTMRRDAMPFVQKCRKCQLHGPLIHQPGEEMTIITSPCPFSQWEIDIVGSFPPGCRKPEVSHSSNRLLFEMGGGRSPSHHNGHESDEIHVAEHMLPIWDPTGSHI